MKTKVSKKAVGKTSTRKGSKAKGKAASQASKAKTSRSAPKAKSKSKSLRSKPKALTKVKESSVSQDFAITQLLTQASSKSAKSTARISPQEFAVSTKRGRPSRPMMQATRSMGYYALVILAMAVGGIFAVYQQSMVSKPESNIHSSTHAIENIRTQAAEVQEEPSEKSGANLSKNSEVSNEISAPVKEEPKAKVETKAERHTASTSSDKKSSDQNVDWTGPLVQEFKKVQNKTFEQKIAFWSDYIEKNLEGRKKVMSQVGGAKVNDLVPLIPELYDCTTFVETVAALSRSQTPNDFVKNLVAIRYRNAQPSFENRNHFPESDWIPNNQRAKILTDITQEVGTRSGVSAKTEHKNIDRGKWLNTLIAKNALPAELADQVSPSWKAPTPAQVPYLNLSEIKKILKHIPSGTVLNLVHQEDSGHPVLITHQGFVIREGKQILLRHASIGGRIRTNDLYSYLAHLHHASTGGKTRSTASSDSNTDESNDKYGALPHFEKNKGQQKRWPLIGINLDQINDSTSATNLLSDSR